MNTHTHGHHDDQRAAAVNLVARVVQGLVIAALAVAAIALVVVALMTSWDVMRGEVETTEVLSAMIGGVIFAAVAAGGIHWIVRDMRRPFDVRRVQWLACAIGVVVALIATVAVITVAFPDEGVALVASAVAFVGGWGVYRLLFLGLKRWAHVVDTRSAEQRTSQAIGSIIFIIFPIWFAGLAAIERWAPDDDFGLWAMASLPLAVGGIVVAYQVTRERIHRKLGVEAPSSWDRDLRRESVLRGVLLVAFVPLCVWLWWLLLGPIEWAFSRLPAEPEASITIVTGAGRVAAFIVAALFTRLLYRWTVAWIVRRAALERDVSPGSRVVLPGLFWLFAVALPLVAGGAEAVTILTDGDEQLGGAAGLMLLMVHGPMWLVVLLAVRGVGGTDEEPLGLWWVGALLLVWAGLTIWWAYRSLLVAGELMTTGGGYDALADRVVHGTIAAAVVAYSILTVGPLLLLLVAWWRAFRHRSQNH